MRPLLLFALVAAIATSASAQRMAFGGPHFSGGMRSHGFAGGARHSFPGTGFPGGGFPGSVYYPLGFGDSLYSDYLQSTGYPVASQPNVFVMQPPPAPAPAVPSPPVEPLMIELRGDRYVQVSGPAKSNAQMIDQMPVAIASAKPPEQTSPGRSAVSAVLVFRDGHNEEIADYTIAGGAVYARAEDYNSGSWNRKIELTTLNLPETVKQNQSRGVRFQLPTYPNEVRVGP